jgi:hypothetical protein
LVKGKYMDVVGISMGYWGLLSIEQKAW